MKYIELNDYEMLDLLAGVRGVYALAGIDFYSNIAEAPKFNMCPIRLYISNVLDLNFTEDIENNKTLNALCKTHEKEIQKAFPGYWNWVDDQLQQIVCDNLRNETLINEATRETIDNKLKEYYNFIIGLNDLKPKYKYEECGELLGERIYKRIEL